MEGYNSSSIAVDMLCYSGDADGMPLEGFHLPFFRVKKKDRDVHSIFERQSTFGVKQTKRQFASPD